MSRPMPAEAAASTSAPRVLVIDDDRDVADSLRLLFEAEGAAVSLLHRPAGAVAAVADAAPDVVLCDLRMPGIGGLEVLSRIREERPDLPVVLMSAYGSLDSAREAIAAGAADYVRKPLGADDLSRVLALAAPHRGRGAAVQARPAPAEARFGSLIGRSPAMRHVFRLIERIAPFPTTVLLSGESGVGKELVAAEIHRRSPRAGGPFVPVNCGAIPETLLESELFGYRKGAFTGADRDHTGLIAGASGGTLFLDEIGDLPSVLQVKLLRVIQEGEVQPLGASRPTAVDVRWITATLRDLEADVATGRFRQDLYFRLHVMQVDLPPLRRRGDDLEILAADILARLEGRYGRGIKAIDRAALDALSAHPFPGNIRELENILERAYILGEGETVTRESVAGLVGVPAVAASGRDDDFVPASLSIKQESRRLEARLIRSALERTGGNRTQAARLLEISHRALLYKIREYGLEDVR